MPGLPQSGFLSQKRLISHLALGGFFPTDTPMLFRHDTRNLDFTLVVDDFGVKYHHRADFDYLHTHLSQIYDIKPYPVATSFLGYTIHHDRDSRTITLSYPGYISSLLARVRPTGIKHCKSPSIYTPPIYGSKAPQTTATDLSPPASSAEAKILQIAVGSILYYARAVDGRMLESVCELSALQTNPTSLTIQKLDRLLGYAAAHPSGMCIIKASDMFLKIQSDASFNSRPKSKSVAGGFHYLGRYDDPSFFNASIVNLCASIPVVCGAVSEAELAAAYANGHVAIEERNILASLGYPQPPTPLVVDNDLAVALANESITPKKSKSMDHRLHWLRDRVRQLQFAVGRIPGPDNLSDFFTKSLAVTAFEAVSSFFGVDPA
jgi:hypothetical protein